MFSVETRKTADLFTLKDSPLTKLVSNAVCQARAVSVAAITPCVIYHFHGDFRRTDSESVSDLIGGGRGDYFSRG